MRTKKNVNNKHLLVAVITFCLVCILGGIGILALTAGKAAVSLFVSGEGKADVVTEGGAYLAVMAFLYVLPGLTNGFQGYCRGAGRIPVTIFCTFIQISLRTAGTYLLAEKTGIRGIAMASGIGWLCMLVFEIPYVLHHMRTLSEENI